MTHRSQQESHISQLQKLLDEKNQQIKDLLSTVHSLEHEIELKVATDLNFGNGYKGIVESLKKQIETTIERINLIENEIEKVKVF